MYVSCFVVRSAQAFHGAFEDFVTWLRETERKIQRDDPLKLEEGELKNGLKYLKVAMIECVCLKYALLLCSNSCITVISFANISW